MVMASLSVDSEEETSLDLQDGAPSVDYGGNSSQSNEATLVDNQGCSQSSEATLV